MHRCYDAAALAVCLDVIERGEKIDFALLPFTDLATTSGASSWKRLRQRVVMSFGSKGSSRNDDRCGYRACLK
ncbi:hypothetical protein A9R05_23800 [Burkholderia sp. KK1]|nr:hypothetical protein A9R05_23800 [Burkholderia sp. KK1]